MIKSAEGTTWATEYIKETGDLYGAAIMLNDQLQSVVQNYSHLMDQGMAEKADRWIQKQLVPVEGTAQASHSRFMKK